MVKDHAGEISDLDWLRAILLKEESATGTPDSSVTERSTVALRDGKRFRGITCIKTDSATRVITGT